MFFFLKLGFAISKLESPATGCLCPMLFTQPFVRTSARISQNLTASDTSGHAFLLRSLPATLPSQQNCSFSLVCRLSEDAGTYAGLHDRAGSQSLVKFHEQIPQIDHDGARPQTFNICRERRPNRQVPAEPYQLVKPKLGGILVPTLGQEYQGPLQTVAYTIILQLSWKSKVLP